MIKIGYGNHYYKGKFYTYYGDIKARKIIDEPNLITKIRVILSRWFG